MKFTCFSKNNMESIEVEQEEKTFRYENNFLQGFEDFST